MWTTSESLCAYKESVGSDMAVGQFQMGRDLWRGVSFLEVKVFEILKTM